MANIIGLPNQQVLKNKGIVGSSSNFSENAFSTEALHDIIDNKLKLKFIMPFMEGELGEVVNNFDCYYEETILKLNKYINYDKSIKYLSNLALLSLGVVNRGYYIHKDNLASLEVIRQLREDLLGKMRGPAIQTSLKASVQACVSFDMRYISYIQTYGLPPGGIFDPTKLAEFL